MPLKAFYFLTGLGHQAVIIFFALSGFLVGGKALADLLAGHFSWRLYFVRRLTRLWIVLIPVLVITLVLDIVGMYLTNGVGYDGSFNNLYLSGPGVGGPLDISFSTFLGNLGFVQTILVPTYGTNGPLWSLANEFWYYLFFPLAAWIAFGANRNSQKLIGVLALVALTLFLPKELLLLGLIWAAGAFSAWITHKPKFQKYFISTLTRICTLILCCLVLVGGRLLSGTLGDLVLGTIFALGLPVLAHIPSPGRWYTWLAHWGSEISYTLYLTHFPVASLIVFVSLAPERLIPSWFGFGVYGGLILISLIWAYCVWWMFERNTNWRYVTLANGHMKIQNVQD